MRTKINTFAKENAEDEITKVYRYDYKDRVVYYFVTTCCDQFTELYDADCNLICHPDGGLTGQGDGNCSDFFSERKNEKLLWQGKKP